MTDHAACEARIAELERWWCEREAEADARAEAAEARERALREALRPFVDAPRYRDKRCTDVELLCSELWFPPAEAALAAQPAPEPGTTDQVS